MVNYRCLQYYPTDRVASCVDKPTVYCFIDLLRSQIRPFILSLRHRTRRGERGGTQTSTFPMVCFICPSRNICNCALSSLFILLFYLPGHWSESCGLLFHFFTMEPLPHHSVTAPLISTSAFRIWEEGAKAGEPGVLWNAAQTWRKCFAPLLSLFGIVNSLYSL